MSIVNEKSALRKEYLQKRKNFNFKIKQEKDSSIFLNLLSIKEFKMAEIVLVYVSTDYEVDTFKLIDFCFKSGKKVAVPKTNLKDCTLTFYYINSLSELVQSNFGILEPLEDKEKLCLSFTNSVCILPGFSFDLNGYRLGYGKGYYDRFLASNQIFSIGLCYDDFLSNNLPYDNFDKNADLIVTNKRILKIKEL